MNLKALFIGFNIGFAILCFKVSLLTLNEVRETQKIQKERIKYLESTINKKPLVILPQPKHFRIEFSKKDDTLYVYPVLDDK